MRNVFLAAHNALLFNFNPSIPLLISLEKKLSGPEHSAVDS